MKNLFQHIINKGLLLAVVLCSWILSCTSKPPPPPHLGPPLPDPMTFFQEHPIATPPDSLTSLEMAQLQAGDVLLRKGYGLISDYIAATLEEPCALTHCGLIVQQGEKLGVLHTASSKEQEGILVEPLESYVGQSQAYSLVACRPLCSSAQLQQLLKLAKSYQQKAVPFDYSFDDQDDQALYCVELLRDLFLEVFKQDYLPLHYSRGTLSLLGFQDFFDSSKFTLLFNHCSNQQ